jgi:hypothetical protein
MGLIKLKAGKTGMRSNNMEMEQSAQIEMHVSLISKIFSQNPGRFMTFRDIAGIVKKEEWASYDHIMPSLEKLIQKGRLEHDRTYGYCRTGEKDSLRRDIAEPPMTRADFNRLTPVEKAEYCLNGGRVD